jgi:hypothetical protein
LPVALPLVLLLPEPLLGAALLPLEACCFAGAATVLCSKSLAESPMLVDSVAVPSPGTLRTWVGAAGQWTDKHLSNVQTLDKSIRWSGSCSTECMS